jgi:hypothetical protein
MAVLRSSDVGFGSTDSARLPSPTPVAADVIRNHAAPLVAAQEQPAALAMPTASLPPTAGAVCDPGETANEHDVAACDTVTVWPATVSDPDRATAVAFASAANVTTPAPEPVPPDVTASHASFAVAVQPHPAPALTETVPDEAAAARECAVGVAANVHGAPAWEMAMVWPATVIDPLRTDEDVFAATLKAAVPLPVPVAPDVIVNHELALVTVHAHPAVPVTATLPVAAALLKLVAVGVAVTAHDAPACVIVMI